MLGALAARPPNLLLLARILGELVRSVLSLARADVRGKSNQHRRSLDDQSYADVPERHSRGLENSGSPALIGKFLANPHSLYRNGAILTGPLPIGSQSTPRDGR